MTAYQFHPTILREYDIRGIVGETLHESDAEAIGKAYATIVRRGGGKVVAVGRDGRLSSPSLEAALVKGLTAAGVEALRIGVGPTPMLYFAVHHLKADAGIMVTGSHNPPTHNGFKMMLGKKPFFGEDIQEIGKIANAGAFAEGQGSARDVPVFDAYIDRLARDYVPGRPLTLAWDAGNGAPGPAMAALSKRLPGRHILLNEEVDGTFPNHHPDPTVPKNLEQLQEAVKREKCDLGVAFDGDGDRIGVVDGEGGILWGDQILAFLAREVLSEQPGATIIADVKASQTLFDEIARLGGKPMMWKTGHSLIKAKMAETKSPLAGEMSGHIFYGHKFYGHDDGLYVAVRLASLLARSDSSLADYRKQLPKVINTPELRFDCPEDRKFKVVQEVAARLAQEGASVEAVDGVRVKSADGWWLLRASNTQAVLVARCESNSEEGLARLKAALAKQLEASGITLPDESTAGHH
jgi:phosphomannomutase